MLNSTNWVFDQIKQLFLLVIGLMISALAQAQSPTSLSYPTPNVFIANVTSAFLAPSVAGNVTSYSISPALPAGLSFNTNTGIISGTPTVASAVTSYTVTASGGSPTGTTTYAVSIQVTNNYFNNNYNNINFGGTGVTITPKVGTGTAVGNIVLYQNVTTISGQSIDAIVKTTALANGTFTTYDQIALSGNGYSSNEERFFSPQFNFTAAGTATFDFQFILGGSYNNTTNTGSPIVLQNVQINSYDIDGNGGANSNQLNEFGGFSTSELGSATTVVPSLNTVSDLTNFRSNTINNSSVVTADPTRVRVTYGNVSDFTIVVGVGGSGASYFFLDFGAGPAFATAVATSSPSIDLNTTVTGSGNTVNGCGSSLAFTSSAQTNIASGTATLNELNVSIPTANITDGVSEQLLINGATSGGTIALNFANAAAIANVVVGGVTYKVAAIVSGSTRTLNFQNNTGTTFTLANAETLLDAFRYNNAASTPTSGSRVFTVNVLNTLFKSPNVLFTAFLNCVSIGGFLYHDNNGVTDNTVNATGTQFTANQVYVVRVNSSNNQVIDSRGVSAGGGYSFGTVTAGTYFLYVSNSAPSAGTVFNAATYPAGGYVSTGENLGSGTGTDLSPDGKIIVTVGSNSLPQVNMGIQIPPVSSSSSLSNVSNPGGFNYYTIPAGSFTAVDADGSISSITISSFPTGVNYLKIDNVVYNNPSGGICPPQIACTNWPGSIKVTYSGGVPTQTISIDPAADVTSSTAVTFFVTDNAGAVSGSSTLTIPVAVTNYYTIAGNVWSDYNGNGVKDATEPFNATAAAGQNLYVLAVQKNNTYSGQSTVLSSSVVSASTGYSLSGIPASNNYEIWLVSAATQPAAGSAETLVVPNLATGWKGVSTINGAAAVTLLNTIHPVIAIANLSSGLGNVSFGIQQTAVADAKSYTNVNSGSGGPLTTVSIQNKQTPSVVYAKSLSMTGSASSGNLPGMPTGSDPDGGAGGSTLSIASGTPGFTLVINPAAYTNTGSVSVSPTMVTYNDIQLQSGGCKGSDIGNASCSLFNSSSGYWEIPTYNVSLLKLLGTTGTTQMGFAYAWKDGSGATGSFSNYNAAFDFALPLHLLSFSARNNEENSVNLIWNTTDENNTDRFEIERSASGRNFTMVGSLKAAGSGSHTYNFTDHSIAADVYYRLAMYDRDGSVSYSSIEFVKIGTIVTSMLISPNPVRKGYPLTITYKPVTNKNISVLIYESSGRQVFKGKPDGSGSMKINASKWLPGVYYITIDNGKTKEFSSFIVR